MLYSSPMSAQTHQFRYQSPLGSIELELVGDSCHRIRLGASDAQVCSPDHPMAIWLRGYFLGKRLPIPAIAPAKTPFQAKLRKALLKIPAGEIRTYGELAKQLNSSPRAVGQSLGANPLPILIPCHRVVAAHGIGGFSGGKGWKEKLLEFEGSI